MKNYLKIIFLIFIFIHNGLTNAESILIQNVTIFDGKTNNPYVGNVLIDDNKISRVSSSNMRGDKVIDAT